MFINSQLRELLATGLGDEELMKVWNYNNQSK